ncbi:serine hydrolase domain-containing protein [Metasolibacillus meyeri]|uniref:serine hydrolase domain-containing protein n=1 Tax=Metasolibacillus meyeri TaxID=1071052 RepID=UPI000D31F2EB|nr:serine hydrolase [Metasolibacillus meyeri]
MYRQLQQIIKDIQNSIQFSGTVLVAEGDNRLNESFGYANRSEQIANNLSTRFGIASGCKLFTAIAICQLVEKGQLSFQTKLSDCLQYDFLTFDSEITIHHLLTHTSGIPDYFDEEVMTDFEELWVANPMYHMRNLSDFLPLFQHQPMKYRAGEKFHYNNAGYILLGLIVEHSAGMSFADYVQAFIFDKAGMSESGYFALDALPSNTALGYIDQPDGTWKTNIYSVPVKGGSDGGAFVTVEDMKKLWDALMNYQLLTENSTNTLLSPHVQVNEDGYYGYGVWIKKRNDTILKYHIMGYDPGVSFHSAYYPKLSSGVVVCSNKSQGAFDLMRGIEGYLIEKLGK